MKTNINKRNYMPGDSSAEFFTYERFQDLWGASRRRCRGFNLDKSFDEDGYDRSGRFYLAKAA